MVTIADGGATRSPDGTASGASSADLARLMAFAGSAVFTTAGISRAAACRFSGRRW